MSQENEYRNDRLQELGGSDFEIADGQPNIKGWDVKDEKGEYIGEVEELLFDPQSRKVRYIVLDLEGNAFDLDARQVLVPIGIAALHENDDDVILCGVAAEHLRSLPDYDKNNLTHDTENSIRSSFIGTGTERADVASASATDVDFYDHDFFNDANLYKRRAPLSGISSATDRTDNSGSDLRSGENEYRGMRLRSRTGSAEDMNTGRMNTPSMSDHVNTPDRSNMMDDEQRVSGQLSDDDDLTQNNDTDIQKNKRSEDY
jgi:hypothetical protein